MINEAHKIDFLVRNHAAGEIYLLITDHLRWDDQKDDVAHQQMLQDKIYSYLDWIESGDLYRLHPDTRGLQLIIGIVAQFPPSARAQWLTAKLGEVAWTEARCKIEWVVGQDALKERLAARD